jgi:hypothetical protein
MAILTTERDAILNAYCRGTSYAGNASLFLSLHIGDPGNTGASEFTSYAGTRPAVTFGVASGQASLNDAPVVYDLNGGGTVTHAGLWTATSGGTFKGGGILAAAKVVSLGQSVLFGVGSVVLVLN